MKGIKIYLVVVSVMLIAALAMGIYVWYMYQTLQAEAAPDASLDTGGTP